MNTSRVTRICLRGITVAIVAGLSVSVGAGAGLAECGDAEPRPTGWSSRANGVTGGVEEHCEDASTGVPPGTTKTRPAETRPAETRPPAPRPTHRSSRANGVTGGMDEFEDAQEE